ncbi:MAG: ArgP/LysG family DNA-binding transcriptional regulator [Brevibacterium yomogidense]|uniref:ArgP/LysG family DNA-binding transcriptional regulator n=1 Tax=Brevibacterium sp. Mu109 TaxID=1255669 RepID=UPI000C667431|nr:ArgP/LysG family DNA-binding transcriptional regulator [Brevibacterium sp. Mu109]SMX64484.1 LysR family transcriptional regulator, chromosome initiation inhibitor [Brevibacterium sp. Mu109]
MRTDAPSLVQLAALVAVVDEGGFDAAGYALGVSTSAVSQRIRALESTMGHVLVARSTPPRVTSAGEAVLATARQVVALVGSLTPAAEVPSRSALPIAVGADALGTWLSGAIEEAADWDDVVLRVSVEDQDVGHQALARGDVLGALSSLPTAQTGCTATPLGKMRYVPVVSQKLAARHLDAAGHLDLTTCPVLTFGAADELQHRVLRAWCEEHDAEANPPTHMIGAQDGFVTGLRAGLGWGCIHELLLGALPDVGDLVRIPGLPMLDVDLHWHRWATELPVLDRFSTAVEAAAARALRPF